jgi:hypothetical protein
MLGAWNRRFLLMMTLYVAVLIPSLRFVQSNPQSPWRVAVALAPALPIVLIVLSGVRRVREMDELQQRKSLEAGTFAYLLMTIFCVTYGFLQNVGFPMVNLMFVGAWMIGLFGIGQMIAWLRYR